MKVRALESSYSIWITKGKIYEGKINGNGYNILNDSGYTAFVYAGRFEIIEENEVFEVGKEYKYNNSVYVIIYTTEDYVFANLKGTKTVHTFNKTGYLNGFENVGAKLTLIPQVPVETTVWGVSFKRKTNNDWSHSTTVHSKQSDAELSAKGFNTDYDTHIFSYVRKEIK